MKPVNLKIESICGYAPVHGEGTVNGVPFYFRAFGRRWEMAIAHDPAVAMVKGNGWYRSEPWGASTYSAGYMPIETATEIITKCANEYAQESEG
jgi:hypothetical protein